MIVYVVICRSNLQEPVAAFTSVAAAEAYAARQNSQARQRHPHAAMHFNVQAIDVDALK